MGNVFYFGWEADLMIWIQAHISDFIVKLANFASFFGEDLVYIFIMGLFFWCIDKRKGVLIGTILTVSGIAFAGVKNIACRRRPYMDIEGIKCLRPVEPEADIMDIAAQGYSFPSGHSANAAAVYGSLGYFIKKPWAKVVGIGIPLFIGLSRVILGNHFPTDVLVGWAIGVIVLFAVPAIADRVKSESRAALILCVVCGFGWFYCKTNDFYTFHGMMCGLLAGAFFEKKYVKFEMPKKWYFWVTRLLGGFAVYFILYTVLKFPFSSELLASATYAQFIIRFFRYAIILFVEAGIYPMLFKLEKKFEK